MSKKEAVQFREFIPVFSTEDLIGIHPITGFIPPDKRGAKRHSGIHPYFTTRPYNVVQRYIQAFTSPGEVILDPYCGSGVTPIEALILKRVGIGFDINPWACFITEAKAISPININKLIELFNDIKKQISNYILSLNELDEEQINIELKKHWYPQNPIPSWVDQDKTMTVDKLFTPRQLLGLSIILENIRKVNDQDLKKILLLAFSGTLVKTNKTYVSSEKRGELRGQSRIFHHWQYSIPKLLTEVNPWRAFEARFNSVVEGKKETNFIIGNSYNNQSFRIYQESALKILKILDENSVDYVFTDPPYGSSIAYLDLSTLWYAWLNFDVKEDLRREEAIEGGQQDFSREHYLSMLSTSIESISKVLKHDRWFSLVYVNKDPAIWSEILKMCGESKLEWFNAVPQPNNIIPTITKIKNPLTTISGDIILNFQRKRNIQIVADEKVTRITNTSYFLIEESKRTIISHLGATTDEIIFNVVTKLLNEGALLNNEKKEKELEVKSLIDFLPREFEIVCSYWHLKENSTRPEGVKDEDWLRYLIFRTLLTQSNVTIEDINNTFITNYPYQTYDKGTILKALKQVGVPEGNIWRVSPNLVIQLRLPLDKIPLKELPSNTIRALKQRYLNDDLFKIKPVHLEETLSNKIDELRG